MPLLITRRDLKQLLSMADVVEAVEAGFREYKIGRCSVPLRMPVKVAQAEGLFLFMPACLEGGGAFGTKIISVFPGNAGRGVSTLQSVYLLNDPATGELLAIMDGLLLTALRTGAASAVATRHLSRKSSSVLGVIGAGAQAPFQVEAILTVRPLHCVVVYDPHAEAVEKFAKAVSVEFAVPVKVASDPQEVIKTADILVTVTTSRQPVFDGRDLRSGTHINAVGAFTPEMREIDDATVTRARIVVDTYEGCLSEAGDLLIPMKAGRLSRERIEADLGEIVMGVKPGRRTDDEITLFESVGFAVEDVVTARLAYRRAKEKGLGREFSLET